MALQFQEIAAIISREQERGCAWAIRNMAIKSMGDILTQRKSNGAAKGGLLPAGAERFALLGQGRAGHGHGVAWRGLLGELSVDRNTLLPRSETTPLPVVLFAEKQNLSKNKIRAANPIPKIRTRDATYKKHLQETLI